MKEQTNSINRKKAYGEGKNILIENLNNSNSLETKGAALEQFYSACKNNLKASDMKHAAAFFVSTAIILVASAVGFGLDFALGTFLGGPFGAIIGGTIALFTQLSNFFFNRQNRRLTLLKTDTADEVLKEEIDFYLNRRVVCPKELLAGAHLNFPDNTPETKKSTEDIPLILETEDTLNITRYNNGYLHLITRLFQAEIKKPEITLNPKALFLQLIDNHPTYMFLKNELKLSDFEMFMLLGQIPEGADMSLLRHPLQWFPMFRMAVEALINEKNGFPSYSEKSFKSSHAHHVLFFSMANTSKLSDAANKAGLDILAETTNQLSVH